MNEKRYLVCSDLHGQYELWKQIKEYITDNDILIFLGDAIDRGPHGIKIAREMLEDKRVIYLLGNHEDMMIDWFLSQEEREEKELFDLWMQNGGRPTYEAFLQLNPKEQKDFILKLLHLDYEMEVEYNDYKVFLNHAGSNPNNNVVHNRYQCLWRRDHFHKKWPKGNNDMIIHGHTPYIYMIQEYGVTFQKDSMTYCNGHKVCLDWGCFATGIIPLYNLNEKKLQMFFKVDEVEK